MDVFSGLMHGFSVALMPANLLWCLVGCFLGTVVGILPGLGPAATIAMLLPMTYNMSPTGGIIMLTAFTTAPNTAVRQRRSSSTCPVNHHRS